MTDHGHVKRAAVTGMFILAEQDVYGIVKVEMDVG